MSDARCAATTKRGAPCRRRPMPATNLCSLHIAAGAGQRHADLADGVQTNLVALFKAGNYIEVALAAAGVPRATFYDWIARGDPAGTAGADRPYREFRAEIDRARAEGEARNVAIIAKAASTSWQAAAWLLERSQPERWDKPSQRQHLRDAPVEAELAEGEPLQPRDEFTDLDELAKRREKKAS